MELWQEERGFTVVEVVITLVILVLLLSGGYSLLESGLKLWHGGEERVDLQQNVRIGMDSMLKEVYLAHKLEPEISYSIGKKYDLDQSHLLLVNAEGKKVAYFLDSDDVLYRHVPTQGGGKNPVAYGIKSVKFSYNNNQPELSNLVTIELVGADESGNEYSLKSSAKIRILQ